MSSIKNILTIRKDRSGPIIFWIIAILSVPVWLLSTPETTFRHNIKPFFIFGSQMASHLGFSLFALSLLLSSRSTWLEDYFGGQDKMYHTHHTMGKTAFVLLLIHPVLIALRWVPENITKTLWYILPLHRRFEVDLGSYALLGLILLMVITLTRKLPYDKWKITHKFTGLFFIIGVFHIFLLSENVTENIVLFAYTSALSLAGTAGYLYKTFLFDLLVKKYNYIVEDIKRPSDKIMEINLVPENRKLHFIPGQYCFFSFSVPGLKRESHPFTICNASSDHKINLMVKALGDYTSQLYNKLEKGNKAVVEGPYGRFDYKNGSTGQIWIGGGVGMAPFTSWVRDLDNNPWYELEVDLYYCVNTIEEAIHMKEFEDIQNKIPGFKVHLVSANREGFLDVSDIRDVENKDIFICGPKEMRSSLLKGFTERKVSRDKIHYEDFDFI